MRLSIIMCLAVAGTLTAHHVTPTKAAACNCIRSGFELVSPATTPPAPIDTQVRVSFADVWRVPVRIVVRDDRGRVIAATQRTVGAATADGRRVVEVTPRAPLAPGMTYEVVALELGARHVATVVGVFHTDAAHRPALAAAGSRASTCAPRDGRPGAMAPRWPWWLAVEHARRPALCSAYTPPIR